MADIGTLTAHITMDTHRLNRDAMRAQTMFRGMAGQVNQSFGTMSAAATRFTGLLAGLGAGIGLTALAGKAARIGTEFEYSMATVGGVMRATGEEMEALTAKAKEMGERTEWTASQAASSLRFLGMAGFSATKAIKALPGTLDLATAGNLDLGRAADIATNALTAMRLPVEELSRVNDVFIGTITRSNTNMEMMAESFRYAAPVAQAYGYSIEELSGLIGKLGDAGIQGSMAGTQLAMAMQKATDIAGKMGLASSDLLDVIDDLKKAGYSTAEIMDMFGLRAGRAVGVLADRTDEVRKFQDVLNGVDGEAEKLADTMRNTVKGSFAELKSVIESVAIDSFMRYRNELRDTLRSMTAWIRDHKEQILAIIDTIGRAIGAVVKVIGSAFEVLGGFMNGVDASVSGMARAIDSTSAPLRIFDSDIQAITENNEALAKALGDSNENVTNLLDAFRRTAPVARDYGYSTERLVRLLEAMADAGMEGADAGEGLAKAIGEANEIANRLRLSSNDLVGVLQELRDEGYLVSDAIAMFSEEAQDAAIAASNLTRLTKEGALAAVEVAGIYETEMARVRASLEFGAMGLQALHDEMIDYVHHADRMQEATRKAWEPPDLTPWQRVWGDIKIIFDNAIQSAKFLGSVLGNIVASVIQSIDVLINTFVTLVRVAEEGFRALMDVIRSAVTGADPAIARESLARAKDIWRDYYADVVKMSRGFLAMLTSETIDWLVSIDKRSALEKAIDDAMDAAYRKHREAIVDFIFDIQNMSRTSPRTPFRTARQERGKAMGGAAGEAEETAKAIEQLQQQLTLYETVLENMRVGTQQHIDMITEYAEARRTYLDLEIKQFREVGMNAALITEYIRQQEAEISKLIASVSEGRGIAAARMSVEEHKQKLEAEIYHYERLLENLDQSTAEYADMMQRYAVARTEQMRIEATELMKVTMNVQLVTAFIKQQTEEINNLGQAATRTLADQIAVYERLLDNLQEDTEAHRFAMLEYARLRREELEQERADLVALGVEREIIDAYMERQNDAIDAMVNRTRDRLAGLKQALVDWGRDIARITEDFLYKSIVDPFTSLREFIRAFYRQVADAAARIVAQMANVELFKSIGLGSLVGASKDLTASAGFIEIAAKSIATAAISLAKAATSLVGASAALSATSGPFPFDIGDISWLAKGGVITKPQTVMVGERGPEAIIPMKRIAASAKDIQQVLIGQATLVPMGFEQARDIRGFAEGGIVSRPELVQVAEKGTEAIIPLDKISGSLSQIKDVLAGHATFVIMKIKEAAQFLDPMTQAVPALATGGMVTQPTFAMIGEAGPEVVIPLDKLERLRGYSDTQPTTVNFHVETPDIRSFKDSESQLMSRAAVAISQATRRNR